ncbi:MAG: copper resistance protein CopC [Actinomycetota bacterium]
MILRGRLPAALLLACAGLLLFAPGAGAHALLQSSDPPAGAQVDGAPESIVLTFSEDPEVSLSTVRVLDTSGASFESGKPIRVPSKARTIRVPVRELPKGVYTVAWRVLSRVDGHVTGGAFAFGVGVSPQGSTPPPTATAVTPPVSAAEVSGRWLFYVGLFGLIGGAWIAGFAFPGAPDGSRRFTAASWIVSAAGLVLLGLAQRSAAGVSLGDLLGTPIGHALIWRAAGIGGAGLALAAAAKLRGENGGTALALAGMAGAGALFAHVDAGHAAASEPVWRNVAAQFVHALAAALWIGGLGALLSGVRGLPAEDRARAIRRFSGTAGFALLAVAITGTVRAIDEVGSWSGLTGSTYGRLVIAKAALIAALAGLGAINRYRNVPRAAQSLSGLRRVSRGELVLAALALAAAGGLASVSPPAGATSADAAPADRIVVVGSDFAETVRIRLEVAPGFAGPNTFVARIVESDSGEPIDAGRVALAFRFVDATIGGSELELTRTGAGTYRGEGSDLSLDGPWTVTVLVQQATDSAEIELSLETRCRAEAVPISGGPTLYNVTLPAGSAQLYVDPGTAGPNELHVTFFNAQGGELPVPTFPTMTGTRNGSVTTFEVRRFTPGHFVSDATLEAGRYKFAFAGTLPDGGPVRGCFEETIR